MAGAAGLLLLASAAAVSMSAGSKSAVQLSARAQCAGPPPKGVAYLRWKPSRIGQQRVDVTIFRDGFSTKKFHSSSRLASTRERLTWRRVSGEALHYWRVRTRANSRWYASATATFEGPGCVGADMQPATRSR